MTKKAEATEKDFFLAQIIQTKPPYKLSKALVQKSCIALKTLKITSLTSLNLAKGRTMGPVVSILTKNRILTSDIEDIRHKFSEFASFSDKYANTFYIESIPYYYDYDSNREDSIQEIKEIQKETSNILPWIPHDLITFSSGIQTTKNYDNLCRLCLEFTKNLDGIIDFGRNIIFKIQPIKDEKVWRDPYLNIPPYHEGEFRYCTPNFLKRAAEQNVAFFVK